MTSANWQVSGEYFETCSCDFLCPCTPANLAGKLPKGECTFAMVFQISTGRYENVQLDGLSFVVIGHAPHETMAEGDLSVGVITDERADDRQRDALVKIASGEAGGPMAGLGPLVKEFLGTEARKIEIHHDGMERRVNIEGMLQQGVKPMIGADGVQPIYLENTVHPASSRLGLGTSTGTNISAFGLNFSDPGGSVNGHIAPFNWAGA